MSCIETETGGLVGIEPAEIAGETWVELTVRHPIGNGSVFLTPSEVKQVRNALAREQQPDARDDIERLRAALEWYAGPDAYDRGTNPIPSRMPVQDDKGERARNALAAADPPAPEQGAATPSDGEGPTSS